MLTKEKESRIIMNLEEQSDIFCIFHDGYFKQFNKIGNDIEFIVQIEYLAKIINPNFTIFKGLLKNCKRMEYEIKNENYTIIRDLDVLSKLNLEIGYAKSDNLCIKVESYSDEEQCGGNLIIVTENIIIFDESGQDILLNKLDEICKLYWNSDKS
jgi:hypothetical protein